MSDLANFRSQKDKYFGEDHNSPLTDRQREMFNGLNYYGESTELTFKLTPTLLTDHIEVEIPLSTGGSTSTHRWAIVSFELNGTREILTVFREEEGGPLFLPFRDGTSGKETYGVGRYLEVQSAEENKLWVDFNYAYNPFCAYNDNWSCPIPPPENRISSSIRAGECIYPDWN